MIIEKNKRILESIFPEEAVIINIRENIPYVFNRSATKIWRLLDNKSKTLDYLINQLSQDFKISEIKTRRDTQKFLRQLSKRKLVVIRRK